VITDEVLPVDDDPTPVAGGERPGRIEVLLADRWRMGRWALGLAYVLAALFQYRYGMPWASKGFPLEREQLLGWLLVGAVVWSLGRDRREVLMAVVGWGGFGLCFVLYDYSRGAVDNIWGNPVVIPTTASEVPSQAVHNASRVITAEKALFFGKLPTVWLQEQLYSSNNRNPPGWEVITAFTYLTHFITVYVVALVMWIRNRARWVEWTRSLITLITLGVAGYLVYPTAPPWMAGRFELMDDVDRPGTRALRYLHLDFADRLWNKGQSLTNLVAAMPSLHMAFSVLVSAFFWRTSNVWVRVLLVVYPGAMLFTLVYGGEHYILDCLAGGLLAWLAVWVNRWWVQWRATGLLPWTRHSPS